MKFILLGLVGLCLATPIKAQQCATPLSTAIENIEKEAVLCQANNRLLLDQYKTMREQFDNQLVQQRLFFAAVLDEQAKYYQNQLAQTLVVEEKSSGPGWLWWAIPTALSTAALIIAITHHHHHEVIQNEDGIDVIDINWPVIPRPNKCWPPGHCKDYK
jgi:hypothetical protein